MPPIFSRKIMNLTLYKTLDGDNVINKTLTNVGTIEINLKRETDVITPILILSRNETINYETCNYLFIPVLARYYFVRSVTFLNSKLVMLNCEVDYVETYKNDILNSECQFMRNIKTGDYIDVAIQKLITSVTSNHVSDKGFSGEPSMILTSVGAING